MKKCPYCAEEIRDEAIKCRFCGEFLAPVPDSKENTPAQTKPEPKPQNTSQSPQAEISEKDIKTAQKTPSQILKTAKKPKSKPAYAGGESIVIEKKEATAEKAVTSSGETVEHAKKKKDWILIIAIIVFGILLLVIQFSKQLGIEGFP